MKNIKVHLFLECEYPINIVPFVEKAILSPLNFLVIVIEN